jgi:large subunit ribosomal protein L2
MKPTTPGRRFRTSLDTSALIPSGRRKPLTRINPKRSGRNTHGRITVRHQGGRQKRLLRTIDWQRRKHQLPARVTAIEYDPNRTANIALLTYPNGDKSYVLAPDGLKVGDQVAAGPDAEPRVGNALPLSRIPVGTAIHNLEITPGKGAQMVRSAGTSAIIQGREQKHILIKLSSGEIRRFLPQCYATIGQLSNPDWKTVKLGKAGRKRLMGIRPGVRGTAQHPGAHPHGGGEGRSGIGMSSPKSPWGKRTLGKKTRKPRKFSRKHIVKDRRVK